VIPLTVGKRHLKKPRKQISAPCELGFRNLSLSCRPCEGDIDTRDVIFRPKIWLRLVLGVFHRDGFFTMQHSLEKRARQPESDDFLRLPAID
jgi:hypothetical protein